MKIAKLVALAALLAFAISPARSANRQIYPDPAQAKADLSAALKTAAQMHKRVLLEFGGDWCGDCQVLDIYFHDATNRPILESNFVLVHVNIGHFDANVDIAEKYGIPLHKGYPRWPSSTKMAHCSIARRAASLKTCAIWSRRP